MGLGTVAVITALAAAGSQGAFGENVKGVFGGGGEKGKAAPPPVTSLDRQATQADTAARQRLAARRRGSGRQTILSLGGSLDTANVQKPLLGA